MAEVKLRPPTFSPAKGPAVFELPSISWLSEPWHITHSTLPMWKSKRNVQIQYTPLNPSSATIDKANTDRINDLVTYQSLESEKIQTVQGIDKAADGSRGEWNWRGKGMLKIASSHWEVLGWGEEAETGNKWMVTMFAKTLFTKAGLDLYSRERSGLQKSTLESIKKALQEVDDEDVKKMAGQIFEITIDDARRT